MLREALLVIVGWKSSNSMPKGRKVGRIVTVVIGRSLLGWFVCDDSNIGLIDRIVKPCRKLSCRFISS
jgi:hypothetical protein